MGKMCLQTNSRLTLIILTTMTSLKSVFTNEILEKNSSNRSVYYEEADTMKDGVSCSNYTDCMKNYTPGIEYALNISSTVVHEPKCKKSLLEDEGICTCGEYCLSRSLTFDEGEFFYCGPCGRVGSVCNNSCFQEVATCKNGYCQCKGGGKFYEVYYCYIPYYGYEVALQMAITTCIVIAICLLVASTYNAIGLRRMRRLPGIREMIRREGVTESPPDDTPPKYDDVVEELPSYQEALSMSQSYEENVKEGIVNLGYEDDSLTKTTDIDIAQGENQATRRKKSMNITKASSQRNRSDNNNNNNNNNNTNKTGNDNNSEKKENEDVKNLNENKSDNKNEENRNENKKINNSSNNGNENKNENNKSNNSSNNGNKTEVESNNNEDKNSNSNNNTSNNDKNNNHNCEIEDSNQNNNENKNENSSNDDTDNNNYNKNNSNNNSTSSDITSQNENRWRKGAQIQEIPSTVQTNDDSRMNEERDFINENRTKSSSDNELQTHFNNIKTNETREEEEEVSASLKEELDTRDATNGDCYEMKLLSRNESDKKDKKVENIDKDEKENSCKPLPNANISHNIESIV